MGVLGGVDPLPELNREHADSWRSEVAHTAQHGPTSRLLLAVGVGMIVGTPLGWLLSYAGALPFFLGSFFFALLGLVIGASVYRVAAVQRPYRPSAVIAGMTLIVLCVWGLALAKEAGDFPRDMAELAAGRTKDLMGRPVGEFKAVVEQEVRTFLRDHYPPGGRAGYVRWVTSSGEIRKGALPSVRNTLKAPQVKNWWVIRVAASIGLLAFGVGSQMLLLRGGAPANARVATCAPRSV